MAIKDISEKAISLPFKIDAYGGVSSTASQEKIWADRVKATINTGISERVMNVNFGTKISSEVFSEVTVIKDVIRFEITSMFTTYFPVLTLNAIDINFDEITHITTVELAYSIPDGKDSTLTIGTAVIINGTLSSEER